MKSQARSSDVRFVFIEYVEVLNHERDERALVWRRVWEVIELEFTQNFPKFLLSRDTGISGRRRETVH